MNRNCFPQEGWKVLAALKGILQKHNVVLAGGTGLALHLGHRVSHDLDFFTARHLSVDSLISDIKKTGLSFQLISESEGTFIVEIEGVKVAFLGYEYAFLEPTVEYQGINIAGILDIASMKVIAVSQRGTKRDFVDLFVILQSYPFHKIAEHMVRRFGKERINPVHVGKSLTYFSDADSNPEPLYPKGKSLKWDTVKKFFLKHARQFTLDLDAAARDT